VGVTDCIAELPAPSLNNPEGVEAQADATLGSLEPVKRKDCLAQPLVISEISPNLLMEMVGKDKIAGFVVAVLVVAPTEEN
jgi:hypothetical protein